METLTKEKIQPAQKLETAKPIDEIDVLGLVLRQYDDWFTPAGACKMLCPQFMEISEEQLIQILLRASRCGFFAGSVINGQYEFSKRLCFT